MERLMRRLNGSLSRSVRRSVQDVFQQSPLDLRFALQKTLDPRVTFTRASSGTFVGSDGVLRSATTNEARFDHNPTTGESLGLLVEEARTNLVRNNTMVGAVAGSPGTPPTNGWVITNNATYTSSIIGTGIENGINYIDIQYVIAAGAAASGGIIYADTPAGSASTTYIGSYYLKLVSGTSPQARFVWQDNVSTYNRTLFDLTSTLTRYTDTLTTAAGAALARFALGFAASPSGTTFVIRVGLPQVEQGAFATSVIPTTTATVTRAADVASITGANFSSFYNQTEGTVFANYAERASSVVHVAATVSNNTNSERISLTINASNALDVVVVASSTDTFVGNQPTLTAQEYRIGFGYKADNSGVSANGSAITVDSAVTLPTVSQLDVGARAGSTQILNSTIKRLAYWPTRLADTTLQQITQP
jgi:hypothetical protein